MTSSGMGTSPQDTLRKRGFCAYCGGITTRHPDRDGRIRCIGHKGLELDVAPRAVLQSVDLRHTPTCRACSGTGLVFPGIECPNCNGVGRLQAAPRREAVTPSKEREDSP